MEINVNTPQTVFIRFKNAMPKRFDLFDSSGNLYYFRYLDGKTPRIKFNIADAGTYNANVDFELVRQTDIDVPTLPILPDAERDRLKTTQVVYNPNLKGTPARIFTDTGRIEVSKEFYKFPKPIRLFLLLHESGHFFYAKEEYCDLWALVNFMRMGYNRSTAYYALTHILKRSPQNIERIKFLFSNIKNSTGAFIP